MGQLSLVGVKKTYEGKQVLHGLDVEIADKEFVVIVGPSGCGKSTLLRMIAGLEDITAGTIAIDGTVMNDIDPADRGCAMVFQNYALYPHMSVRQNMAYPLKIARMPQAERDRRVNEAAAILGLADYLDRRPAQLSGGQRQRVAMGRAIVREPSVFLFDEPLSNLDAILRVQMRVEIKRLHKRLKATSIFVTHDQVEAMTLADLLIVMNKGVVEQVGTPAAVYRRPASTFVAGFIGAPAMNLLPATVGREGVVTFDIAPHLPLVRAPDLAPGTPLTPGTPVTPGTPLTPGTPVTLGIRPEAITLSSHPERGLPATVDLVEELGGSRVAYCDVNGLELAVVLPAGEEPYEGRQVFLDFGDRGWHLFDRMSGKRLDTPTQEVRVQAGLRQMVPA